MDEPLEVYTINNLITSIHTQLDAREIKDARRKAKMKG